MPLHLVPLKMEFCVKNLGLGVSVQFKNIFVVNPNIINDIYWTNMDINIGKSNINILSNRCPVTMSKYNISYKIFQLIITTEPLLIFTTSKITSKWY